MKKNKYVSNLGEFIRTTQKKAHKILKPMNVARQKFLAACTCAIIDARSVQYGEIAAKMDGEASVDSKVRQIQRFMSDYDFDYRHVALFVLFLVPPKSRVTLCIDRTDWMFGDTSHNILVVTLYSHGVGLPLWFETLENDGGNSHTDDRMYVILKVLELIGRKRIAAIIGDREFIGEAWVKFLLREQLPFYLRIRDNQYVEYEGKLVRLKVILHGKNKICLDNVKIFDHFLSIAAKKLDKVKKNGDPEWLIVVTNVEAAKALTVYKNRWSIEVMFQSFKKRGFHLEQTHLEDSSRLRKLFAICAMAFASCFAVGIQQNQSVKPIKIKNHGYKANSFFRYGLDTIRQYIRKNLNPSSIFKKLLSWVEFNFIQLSKIVM
jgi:hypothetical protein